MKPISGASVGNFTNHMKCHNFSCLRSYFNGTEIKVLNFSINNLVIEGKLIIVLSMSTLLVSWTESVTQHLTHRRLGKAQICCSCTLGKGEYTVQQLGQTFLIR